MRRDESVNSGAFACPSEGVCPELPGKKKFHPNILRVVLWVSEKNFAR
jgi:hypothetical protein